MEALEAIRKRRSVRDYTGETIPKEDLMKIVDAGRLAASCYNRQPWNFILVTERPMIDKLKVAAQWMEKAAAVIAVAVIGGLSGIWWTVNLVLVNSQLAGNVGFLMEQHQVVAPMLKEMYGPWLQVKQAQQRAAVAKELKAEDEKDAGPTKGEAAGGSADAK